MNEQGLFASPKWELVKEVAMNSQSPTSLAKKLHTSIPNVLHHLKLLEAYGVITGKPSKPNKTGKPPTLYGLAKPLAFIALLDKLGSTKRTLNPSIHEKYFLQCIINYKDPDNLGLIKLGLDHPELLSENTALGLNNYSARNADLLILSPDVSVYRTEKSKIVITMPKNEFTFTVWSHTKEEFLEGLKKKEEYFLKFLNSKILHDPKNYFESLAKI